jgi:hypothetical protein
MTFGKAIALRVSGDCTQVGVVVIAVVIRQHTITINIFYPNGGGRVGIIAVICRQHTIAVRICRRHTGISVIAV